MYRYQFEGYPMEILRQTETWRYVRDPMTGTEGWMNRILFNGARHIITANKEHSFGYKNADKSKIIAKLAFGVHGKILSCDSSWCYVSILNNEKVRKMYIEKKNLYGVYTHEIID
jgi:SH3-like domain-containing protein